MYFVAGCPPCSSGSVEDVWSTFIFNGFLVVVAVGELAKEIDINKKEAIVLPINTSEYPTLAQRPKYSLLNTNN